MRDQYLTEAMGECCVYSEPHTGAGFCMKCGSWLHEHPPLPDFSTWQGFGKLWEWAQAQEWFERFLWFEPAPDDEDICAVAIQDKHPSNIIHPDRFADAVYEFLKGREA